MKIGSWLGTVLLALPLTIAAPAFAQDTDVPKASEPNSLTLGLGAAMAPSYEGSDDYIIVPAGLAFGKVGGFAYYTRATTLYLDLIRDPYDARVDIAVGPVANLRVDRAGRIKDAQVRALGELDYAIEAGAFAGIALNRVLHEYDTVTARISWIHDVTNTHDSFIVTPSLEYGTPLSRKAYAGLQLSADYVGEDFASTYYGVTPAGATASGLSPFTIDEGWKNARVSLLGSYKLQGDLTTGGLGLFAIASYSSMLGEFKDSPLVSEAGDADQYFVGGGLTYTF
jgi:outer membrane scaffolding protein for murein synthesis (MipA/OmpV family)